MTNDIKHSIEALNELRNLARATDAFRIESVRTQPSTGRRRVDALVTIVPKSSQHEVELAVEQRSRVTPNEALAGVSRWRDAPPGAVPLLCCPYISPRVAEICEQMGVSYLDKAGNCRISAPGLFIHISGRPNPQPDTRPLANPFAPKSSRIVRLLLENPNECWYVKEVAEKVNVSIGLVYKAKEALVEQGYLWNFPDVLKLNDPSGLLRAWSTAYKNPVEQHALYVLGKTQEIENRVRAWCRQHELRYGLAEFAGAWRLAPMVRYSKPTFYVENVARVEVLREIMESLDAKHVESGANLSLWLSSDPSVFRSQKNCDGMQVMSPIQLYLDLVGNAGRGEEAAQALYEQYLAPRFEKLDQP